MSTPRVSKKATKTLTEETNTPSFDLRIPEPVLVRMLGRVKKLSPFAWGFIAGVAVMSALFGLALLLLFRSLT